MRTRSKVFSAAVIAASLFSAFALAPSASALEDGQTQAVLAQTKSYSDVIDGRMWKCKDTNCYANPSELAEVRTPVLECTRAAQILGAFSSYATGKTTLTADQLAKCNAGAPQKKS